MKQAFMILILMLSCMILLTAASAEELSVVEFDGGSIAYSDAAAQYQAVLDSYSALGLAENIDPEALALDVLTGMIEEIALHQKAEELGLTALSDDELADLTASAEASYESLISNYIDFCSADGMTDAEARAATEAYLADQGQSLQSILDSLTDDYWRSGLYDWICGDVAVTEAEIQAYYDMLLVTQQLQMAEDPSYFDYLYMEDEPIVYYPEGMRYIKHILIGFDEDTALAWQALVGEGDMDDADPDALDMLYSTLDDRVTAVFECLMDGQDFDMLMREYGDDDNMLFEPYSINGYALREGSLLFVSEFTEAAFALENVGDISDPVRSAGGIHFILYAGDVPAGAVPLADVQDALAIDAEEQKIDDAYNAQVSQWVSELHPVYHPEYLLQ